VGKAVVRKIPLVTDHGHHHQQRHCKNFVARLRSTSDRGCQAKTSYREADNPATAPQAAIW
jgi:hypothetical protein